MVWIASRTDRSHGNEYGSFGWKLGISFHQVKQAEQYLEEIILNRLKSKEKNFAKEFNLNQKW
jgi:hypothetical protein